MTHWSVQNNCSCFPTLASMALDVLPICASSVACERLFSAALEIATAKRSRLSVEMFEMLQMLKHGWKHTIFDYAAANSNIVETVSADVLSEAAILLQADIDAA